MRFSVSATNRQPRQGEENGVHYHFLSTAEFRDAVAAGKFIEWEEVYPGRYYGTLRSEIDNAIARGENVILDIDVNGGINVKKSTATVPSLCLCNRRASTNCAAASKAAALTLPRYRPESGPCRLRDFAGSAVRLCGGE